MYLSAARRSTPSFLALRSSRLLLLAPSLLLSHSVPSWAKDGNSGVRLAQAVQPSNAPAAAPDEGRGAGQPRTDTKGLNIPADNNASPTAEPNGPPPTDPATPATPVTPTQPAGTPVTPPASGEAPSTPGSLQATEAEGQEIADVRVVGNRVVPASSILAQVTSRRGAAFSTVQIDRDVQKVTALGFFAAVQYQVTPNLEDARKVDLTIVVVENRVVTGFKFVSTGGKTLQVPEKDLLEALSSKTGAILNTNFVNDDVAKLVALYKERGFAALVTEAPAIDSNGVLTFTIQEAKVSRVDILGLTKTRPSIVRRQIRVKSGDVFDQNKLRRDLNRIYDLGFFEDVNYSIDNDAANPDSVIVKLQLKERRTGQFTFGIGFDSRSQLTGFVTLAENNLNGSGKRAFASVEAGAQRTFDLGFGDPFVGKNNSSYDIGLFSRRIFREPRSLARVLGSGAVIGQQFNFIEQRTGARINYGIPLDEDRTKKILFGYRNERASLQKTDITTGTSVPVIIDQLRSQGRISAISAGFLRDRRDLQLDPSNGGREQIILEQAFSLLGGTQTFTKLDIDVRRYFPLIKAQKVGDLAKLVVANRLVIGQSFGQLPPFEQYFIGGTDTVRGYNIDRQFGDNQIYNNFELRYRFQKKFQIVGFVDAGRAAGGRFSSEETRALFSVGAGVRLQSPLGPIRLDIGKGREGVRTHFGIGSSF
jgi:outer membrane protein insertion porin family